MEGISEDIGSYLDWALEMDLWDGCPRSRYEASEFQGEVANRLIEILQEADDSTFEKLALHFAWLGTPEAKQSLLARDIQQLDFSKGDLILQAGLKKSVSKFWKKHKKEILIGAAIVAIITVVVVVSVSTVGTGTGAVATAGGAALAACEGEKPEKPLPKKEPSQPQPMPATLQLTSEAFPLPHQLAFEEKGVIFDGRLTNYTDILLNRGEPLISGELYPIPPKALWPPFEPPSFLDVQPHPLAPWSEFDFLQAIPPHREELHERIEPPSLETPPPLPKKTSWLANFWNTFLERIADDPSILDPEPRLPLTDCKFSEIFTIPGIEAPWKSIIIGNGMNTSQEEAIGHAKYIAEFAQGHRVDLVYNRSHGPVIDMVEILTLNLLGYSPVTANLHLKLWSEFHIRNSNRPHAKVLQICHSQDTIHVLNALKKAPEEIRKRVIVVAFGPAVVIPNNLCFKAFHYACEGDIVPHGEVAFAGFGGLMKSIPTAIKHDAIIWVPAHPDTQSPHDFQNPALFPIQLVFVSDYIKRNGEYPDDAIFDLELEFNQAFLRIFE